MYDNLLGLLKRTINSHDVEAFASGLVEAKANEFMTSVDVIDGIIIAIEAAKTAEALYPNYDAIFASIQNIESNFPGYPIFRKAEIFAITKISKILIDQLIDLTDTTNIDETPWELVPIPAGFEIPQHYYSYFNNTSTIDSVIYFHIDHLEEIVFNPASGNLSLQIELAFILLSKIGNLGDVLNNSRYALIKVGHAGHINRICAFISLHLVSDGYSIHSPKVYSGSPLMQWKDKIKLDNKYQQFEDIFHVISEYNQNKDVLNKYLKIYQVFEEYMYKSQLVKLEREMGGRLFSLRDFKRMNEDVSEKELSTLSSFIGEVFLIEFSPGITFKDYCFRKWSDLTMVISANDIDDVLIRYRLKAGRGNTYTYASVTNNHIQTVFCSLIYFIRNSIVHNKSTEFHLTYKTLTVPIAAVIERFLIHVLEMIFLKLTIEPSSQLVWFGGTELKIWADD